MFKTLISISMKKIALLLLLVMPAALPAQVNEMFYVPKKSVKQENVSSILSSAADDWGTVGNANIRDVDEYNRRGTATVSAGNVETLLQAENLQTENYEYEYVDETSDYDYSTRIVRFHSPTTVVVSSPWYYDVYPARYYYDYDYCYDSYWNWSIGWGGLGWGISAGWHYPLSWNWGYAPVYPHHHHHHHVVAPPVNRVRSRVPTASIAGGSNRRQSIGSVSTAEKRKPATQVNNRRNERRTPVANTQNSGSNKRRENVGSSSSSRGSGNSSTYNRRSSTSVRGSGNSSGSRSRSSVSGASRSSSRSSASPSRGGTSRGGRR